VKPLFRATIFSPSCFSMAYFLLGDRKSTRIQVIDWIKKRGKRAYKQALVGLRSTSI
jgi:hypothetical protein